MRRRGPRGPGWRSLPPDGGHQPRRLADSLDALTRRIGAPGAAALVVVFNRWADIAGPGLAAHSWPVSVTRGALVVAVDEPGWATSVRALSAQLLRRLEEVAGPGVADSVEVRVSPRHQRPGRTPVVD